jgi:gluconokinase
MQAGCGLRPGASEGHAETGASAKLAARMTYGGVARVVIVVMGVSGVGKTTVGRRLADQLGWPFHDADDLHPPANIAAMRSGTPLTDAQRAPWLASLAQLIGDHVGHGRSMVLACSALSRAHRAALLARTPTPGDVRLVHLVAGATLLGERVAARTGHFFPPELLASQLATLEAPESKPDAVLRVLQLDAMRPVDELVATIREAFTV